MWPWGALSGAACGGGIGGLLTPPDPNPWPMDRDSWAGVGRGACSLR